MRATSWMTILMSLLLIMTTGCTTVTTTALIGQPSTQTAKALQGVWKIGDGVLFMMARENGQLDAALMQRKDGQWQIEKWQLIATQVGEACYIHVRQQDDQSPQDQPARYHFARLLMEEKHPAAILVLSPTAELFQEAVDKGELAGSVILHKGSGRLQQVNLTADRQALLDFIKTESVGSQFSQQPITLTRLSDVEDDQPKP